MNEHERELGLTLQNRLENYLSAAHKTLIPPGTLGGGMGFTCGTSNHSISFDPSTGILTVQTTFTFTVYRHEELPDP